MRAFFRRSLVRPVAVSMIVLAAASWPALAQGQPGGGGGGRGGQGGGGPGAGGFGGGMRFMGGGGPGGGGDMFGAPVTTRDLETYTKVLGLTKDQQETARALVEGVTTEYQPIARSVRDKMDAIRQEFRDTQDPSVWQGMSSKMNEVREARKKIEDSFVSDLKAILTPEQAAKWPEAERTLRRTKTIGRGLMSGERVDLTRLVERADLTPETQAALKEIMGQYEAELDRELVKRNELFEKAMEQGASLFQAFQNGETDKLKDMFDKGREASTRVRDVNRRYERQIEAMLPEDKRAAFAEDFKRESFPMVYRPSFATRTLEAAEKMTDLDENQKTALAEVRSSFTRDQNGINTKMQAAIEDTEKSATIETVFARFNDPAMRELRDSKRELDDATVEKINKVLTEAQRTKLPERDNRGDFGPGGPGGGNNGGGGGRRGANANAGGDTNGDNAQPRQRRGRGQGRQTGEPIRSNTGPA